MELNIKLEAFKDRADHLPLGSAECRISINEGENRYWYSDMVVNVIFRHLCRVLSAGLKKCRHKR